MTTRLFPVFVALAFALTSVGAQRTPPTAQLRENLRLDANTEDFSLVGRVSVGPRGQIVVPLPQDRQLRIYDSTGKRIASVGRRGGGPGEFEALNIMGWIADTLWVHDGIARRTTFIDPAGRVLRTTVQSQATTIKPHANSTARGPMRFYAPSAIFADGSTFGQGRTLETGPTGQQRASSAIYVKVAPNDTGVFVHGPVLYEDPRWMMDVAGFGRPVPFRLMPQAAVSFDGARFATLTADVTSATGGTYTVTLMRTNGDTIFARTYPFVGVAIPPRVRDSVLATFRPRPGGATEGPPDLDQRFQAAAREKMPLVYTPPQTITIGLDNTVWLMMRPSPDQRFWLGLNHRGDPIATVPLPAGRTVHQATATTFWATEADADGLRSVVRFSVTGIACGPPECR